jgi:hypothetical protein
MTSHVFASSDLWIVAFHLMGDREMDCRSHLSIQRMKAGLERGDRRAA